MSNATRQSKIVALYEQGYGCIKIGRQLGVSHRTVLNYLNNAGVKRKAGSTRRRYPIDLLSLTDLSSEVGSYWFGFLLTDGSINKTSKKNTIMCRLGMRDIGHLWKLSRDVGVIYGPKRTKTTIYNGKTYDQCYFYINSKELVKFYIDNGWNDFKHGKINLPNKLNMRHFIRGLIDGDGIITHSRKRLRIGFCSQHSAIIGWLRECLHKELNVSRNKVVRQVINYMYWNGTDALKIAAWLYFDQTRCLERKLNKVLPYVIH